MEQVILVAVNAKYIHSNLAVYSLEAYAARAGQPVQIKEYTINQPPGEILKGIYKSQPGLLCFSCYIWNRTLVDDLAREIHKLLPETQIWMGGPEVTYCAREYLETHPAVHGIMRGEGEATFLELIRHFHSKGNITEQMHIAGITFRINEKIYETDDRAFLPMDDLPFPYEHLQNFQNRILYYESSRGCPFSCSYCLSSLEKKLRFRSLNLVKKDLQFFIDQKVTQVKFVDRTFNCDRERALELWEFLARQDQGITNFHFEIGADLLSSKELSCIKAMRPGLIQLEIGVQSTNQQTIEEIKRTMDWGKLKANVKQIHQGENIHQHLDLIAGLPYEGYESFQRSFNQVYELRPHQLQLGFLKVLKGSLMEKMAKEYGCIYLDREPYEVLQTKWISYEEILSLKLVENMVEVYYNSGQFRHTLRLLEPLFPTPFAFYSELGNYYEEKNYSCISHSRLRRYDILLEFLDAWFQSKGQKEKDKWLAATVEAMTVDLYSREKLKSRPAWMNKQEPWQEAIRKYRRQKNLPKTVHIEVLSKETLLFDYRYKDPLTNNTEGKPITFI